MFGSINKTFGCCGKIFGCSNKILFVVPNFVAVIKPFFSVQVKLSISLISWLVEVQVYRLNIAHRFFLVQQISDEQLIIRTRFSEKTISLYFFLSSILNIDIMS